LMESNQWLVPLETGFGLGGKVVGFAGLPGVPCPGNFGAACCGAAFAAILSFLAFCTQSGQVTSLAFADWNHLPQVLQRIFILLMRGLSCNV